MSEVINKINNEIKKYESLLEEHTNYIQECHTYIEDLKVTRSIVSSLTRSSGTTKSKSSKRSSTSSVWNSNSTLVSQIQQALKDLGETTSAEVQKYIESKVGYSIGSSGVRASLSQMYTKGKIVARKKPNSNANYYKLSK